eukprot:201551-Rhodomonas_salina.1
MARDMLGGNLERAQSGGSRGGTANGSLGRGAETSERALSKTGLWWLGKGALGGKRSSLGLAGLVESRERERESERASERERERPERRCRGQGTGKHKGEIVTHHNLRVAYIAQHSMHHLEVRSGVPKQETACLQETAPSVPFGTDMRFRVVDVGV